MSAGESEGHVMINNRPVCDQGWDDVDAGVLCRMLGFGSGEATTGSHFGEVTTSFIMTDVRCAGDEETILDCPHSLLVSCSPDQAAGVVCRDRQMMAEAGQMYPCQLVFTLHYTQYKGCCIKNVITYVHVNFSRKAKIN